MVDPRAPLTGLVAAHFRMNWQTGKRLFSACTLANRWADGGSAPLEVVAELPNWEGVVFGLNRSFAARCWPGASSFGGVAEACQRCRGDLQAASARVQRPNQPLGMGAKRSETRSCMGAGPVCCTLPSNRVWQHRHCRRVLERRRRTRQRSDQSCALRQGGRVRLAPLLCAHSLCPCSLGAGPLESLRRPEGVAGTPKTGMLKPKCALYQFASSRETGAQRCVKAGRKRAACSPTRPPTAEIS